MDLFKFIKSSRGESYLMPFAGALENNDFHVSFHDQRYGMHFKVNRPIEIKSEKISYDNLINSIKKGAPEKLRQIMRRPRRGHSYLLIIPRFDDSAINVKDNGSRTTIKMRGRILLGYRIIERPETHFLPRDFRKLSETDDVSYVAAVVPETGEISFFVPLNEGDFEKAADQSEHYGYDMVSKMKGIFVTYTLEESRTFLDHFPVISEIVRKFFEEIAEEKIQLYNEMKLLQLVSLWFT